MRLLLAGVRDFPAQMGRPARRTSPPRRSSARDWLLRMWDDTSQTLYYQVGIGDGELRRRSATTTSGGCRRPTTPIGARPASTATSATGRCSAPAPPGALDQPQPRRPRRRRVRRVLPGLQDDATRRSRTAACSAAEHIFDLANTAPSGNLLTVIPFSFYPETEWRDDLELGATELYSALASRRAAGRAAAHRPDVLPAEGGALGERLHHRAERRRRHAQPLRRAAGSPTTSSYRAIAQAGNPAGLADDAGGPARGPEEAAGQAPSRRPAPTRSASASRGPPRTRPRTAPGCR